MQPKVYSPSLQKATEMCYNTPAMAKITTPLTAVYTKVTGGYTGWIEEIPGVNTQGKTLPETRRNLADALEVVVETNRLITKRELRGKDVICEPFTFAAS